MMVSPKIVGSNGQLTIPGWFLQIVPWMVTLGALVLQFKMLQRDVKENQQATCLVAAALIVHDKSCDPGLHLYCNGFLGGKGNENNVHE